MAAKSSEVKGACDPCPTTWLTGDSTGLVCVHSMHVTTEVNSYSSSIKCSEWWFTSLHLFPTLISTIFCVLGSHMSLHLLLFTVKEACLIFHYHFIFNVAENHEHDQDECMYQQVESILASVGYPKGSLPELFLWFYLVLLLNRVSCTASFPWIHCVAKGCSELLILLITSGITVMCHRLCHFNPFKRMQLWESNLRIWQNTERSKPCILSLSRKTPPQKKQQPPKTKKNK